MKFNFINTALLALALSASCLSNVANAGLISHAAGTKAVARHCPDVADYVTCWNRTEQNPGAKDREVEINNASNDASSKTSGANWINTSFSGGEYTLPNVHLYSESTDSWTNFLFAFSYQEYSWEGDEDTLTIASDFNFTMTTGPGWPEDSAYVAELSILRDITDGFDGRAWKPIIRDEDIILTDKYTSYEDQNIIAGEQQSRSISTNFDVKKGDTFYVMSHVKASANNGGWVDSEHSLYTNISAVNTSQTEMVQALSAIQRPDPTAVPEPSTLAIFALGLMGIASRRFNKQV
jgi:hypothetical protein